MDATPFSVLIPAAGASTRLGEAKQIVRYRGKPLLAHVLDIASTTRPLEIIVVTGANAELARQAVGPASARWIHNAGWAGGLGTSIAAGAGAVSGESRGVLIMLCDQYRVEASDLQTLVDTWQSAPERIVAAVASGRCMPPVIFPASLLGGLQGLAGDSGAHRLFEEHFERLTTVDMGNAAFDVDTRAQLMRMQATRA